MDTSEKMMSAGGERILLFCGLAWLVGVVNDGWSGRPFPPIRHQLILLLPALLFGFLLWRLLFGYGKSRAEVDRRSLWRWTLLSTVLLFEALSLAGFVYECRHFARFGYAFRQETWFWAMLGVLCGATFAIWRRRDGFSLLCGVLTCYAAGVLLAIRCFPLNYLRSDMLPVILWADERVIAHLNPYTTMHVGSRLYDFPYLPGVLVAFLPAVLLHLDVRFVNLVCVTGAACVIYAAARPGRRLQAAGLIGVFVLSPFLQYRHDLYLAPHWLALAGAVVLLQRGRFIWAAASFGVSMALYQLSWVLFPFFLLYGLRRRGWLNTLGEGVVAVVAMFAVLAPFLGSALPRIANNTVGQWSHLPHALADPINLSYWVSFAVRPEHLKWVQLVVMAGIFGFCVLRGRCATLTDTVRWMAAALALFIALNVLVDGYFYLTLLLLLLMYTCAATGIWTEPVAEVFGKRTNRERGTEAMGPSSIRCA